MCFEWLLTMLLQNASWKMRSQQYGDSRNSYTLSPYRCLRRSCTSQLLHFTQHIEDGYQQHMIPGTACVYMCAANETVNQKRNARQHTMKLLSNRRFYAELNNKRTIEEQGSVLSYIIFNKYSQSMMEQET